MDTGGAVTNPVEFQLQLIGFYPALNYGVCEWLSSGFYSKLSTHLKLSVEINQVEKLNNGCFEWLLLYYTEVEPFIVIYKAVRCWFDVTINVKY